MHRPAVAPGRDALAQRLTDDLRPARRAGLAEGCGRYRSAPDGKTAYVANYLAGTVTPISTATSTAGKPMTVGNGPIAIG